MFDGAHTNTFPSFCFTRWTTSAVDVTVLPVPGGPYIKLSGVINAFLMAFIWK
jgi:hypothetical protein